MAGNVQFDDLLAQPGALLALDKWKVNSEKWIIAHGRQRSV
jgi:hypothetical protein